MGTDALPAFIFYEDDAADAKQYPFPENKRAGNK